MKKIRVNMVSESEISIQGHGVHTAYMEMAAALERQDDIELIRNRFGTAVDCDIIHLHTIGSRTWRKLFQRGPKKVVSAHVVPDSFVGSLFGAKLWLPFAALYLRWFYGRADALIAVSETTKQELVKLGIKRPIHTIYNSIDTRHYRLEGEQDMRRVAELRRTLGIADDQFVVIGAGQVQPRKRVDAFIAAARARPDMTFIWVGGMPFGHLAAQHRAMTEMIESAPSNVLFPGIVELGDMKYYYGVADVFWLPSEQETFGLVVVEAAASGLPVLLRDLPDYSDTYADVALLGTDETFVHQLEQLRDDASHRQRYTKKAAQLAARFDSQRIARQVVELYRNLL